MGDKNPGSRAHNDYFLKFEPLSVHCYMNIINSEKLPKNGLRWEIVNELKPVDLYCYLSAKYGPPNGPLSLLKDDDSDNLIHWDWVLINEHGIMSILGMNFRTEINLSGDFAERGLELEDLINQFKSDFKNYGKKITEFRKNLEYWTQFVNPYHRIKNAVEQNFEQLENLGVNPSAERIPNPKNADEIRSFEDRWNAINLRYSAAVGLVFGLRAMLPVMAESFINLLIFLLAKPEIQESPRLFKSVVTQHIDVRVQFLHLQCNGFKQPVDYTNEQCKAFHSLMNERNDLLHGNVEVEKLAFGNVYFLDKTPIFETYEDHWSVSIGASMDSVKFSTIHKDFKVVKDFISYILSLLDEAPRKEIEIIIEQRDLGLNKKTKRIGLLFSERIADFRAAFIKDD